MLTGSDDTHRFPFFVIYNNCVGYSRKAQTHRKVLPQIKWSVLNLMMEGVRIQEVLECGLLLADTRLFSAALP